MSIDGILYKYISESLYDLSDRSETNNIKDKKRIIFDFMKRRADELDKTKYQSFSNLKGGQREKAALDMARSKQPHHWQPWLGGRDGS
jgi:hypothetical protein